MSRASLIRLISPVVNSFVTSNDISVAIAQQRNLRGPYSHCEYQYLMS